MQGFAERYTAAVARERLIRDLAYVEDMCERIGSFEVLPLTMAHIIELRAVKSPFIGGGFPEPRHVSAILWRLSPKFSRDPRHPLKKAIEARVASMGVEELGAVIVQLQEYTEEAFYDFPAAVAGSYGKTYYSEAAALCDAFGDAYGWPNKLTLHTPLKQLFQQLKIIDARKKAKARLSPIMFNPSDAVIGEMLTAENEALKDENARAREN